MIVRRGCFPGRPVIRLVLKDCASEACLRCLGRGTLRRTAGKDEGTVQAFFRYLGVQRFREGTAEAFLHFAYPYSAIQLLCRTWISYLRRQYFLSSHTAVHGQLPGAPSGSGNIECSSTSGR